MTLDMRVFKGPVSRLLAIVCIAFSQSIAPLAAAQEAPAQSGDLDRVAGAQGSAAVDLGEELADEPLFTQEDLEELVAPIALYPDPLLIQVLIASTYPLDVVRAQRWLKDNADISDEELIDKAELEAWDPSIISLAPFPDVIDRMATNLDWTETLGDAMALQSDDVLDAVQTMRALAQANGVLESGEEITVSAGEEDTIVIEPTDPEVVYVPVYDTQYVYAQAPQTTTAPAPTTTVVESSSSSGNVLAAGLFGFGLGVILTSIYRDNRKDYYWGPRYGSVNWHVHTIRPPYYRPGVGYRPPHYRPPPPAYRPGVGWRPRSEYYRDARRRADDRRDVRREVRRDADLRDRGRVDTRDRARRLEQDLQRRGRDQDNVLKGARPERRPGAERPGGARDRAQARPAPRDSAFSGRDGARASNKSQKRGESSVDRARRGEPQAARPRDRSAGDRAERPKRPAAQQPKQRQQAAPKQSTRAAPPRESRGGAFQRSEAPKASRDRGQKSAGKLRTGERAPRRGG